MQNFFVASFSIMVAIFVIGVVYIGTAHGRAPKSKFYDFQDQLIDGEIKNKSKVRIIRDGTVVYNGEISSLFREKNAVKEVSTGLECGISLKDFIDFKEKDIIESYQIEKIERRI